MISFEAKTVFTEDETVVKIVRGFQRSWPHSKSWKDKGRAQKTVKETDGVISAAAVTTIVDFMNSLLPQECRAEMDNILKIGQENLGAPELAMVGVPVLVAASDFVAIYPSTGPSAFSPILFASIRMASVTFSPVSESGSIVIVPPSV